MKLGSTINVMNDYKTTFHIANTTSITLLATGDFMCLCGTSVEVREQLRRDVFSYLYWVLIKLVTRLKQAVSLPSALSHFM